MNIQCFDLLFFYGNSPISNTIKLAQKAIKNELLNSNDIPSHVAVVISKKYLPTLKNVDNEDDYYLWESNVTIKNKIDKMADIVDVESGHFHPDNCQAGITGAGSGAAAGGSSVAAPPL